jgi:16S rRNA processing protein RimM
MLTPYLYLGDIVKPQGLRGEVKLRHDMGDPAQLLALTTLYLKRGDTYAPIQLESARVNGTEAFLTLAGIRDRNAAEALRGAQVYIDRAHARPLAQGETYIADMLGMQAVDSEGRAVGQLTDVLQNGGADVLVFKTPRGNMMAPFLKRLVLTVDVQNSRMVLDSAVLPEVALYENSDPDDLP